MLRSLSDARALALLLLTLSCTPERDFSAAAGQGGGTGSTSGSTTSSATTCAPTEVRCAGACVDPMSDALHCGAGAECASDPGVACAPGERCAVGSCKECFESYGRRDQDLGATPVDAILVDIDGDGKLDIVSANNAAQSLSVYQGQGNGSFAPLAGIHPIALGARPSSVTSMIDSKSPLPRLVVANPAADAITLLTAPETGTGGAGGAGGAGSEPSLGVYNVALPTGSAPVDVAVADLNGDGFLDAVTANSGTADISVMLSDPEGKLVSHVEHPTHEGPSSIAIADLNGDEHPDVIVTNAVTNDIAVFAATGSNGYSLLSPLYYPVGVAPAAVAVGDLNGDALPDLVVANGAQNTLTILYNSGPTSTKGDIAFSVVAPATALGSDISRLSAVTIADINADGRPDIIATDTNGNKVYFLFGPEFTKVTVETTAFHPDAIAAGDFNGDGWLDLVTANSGSSLATILTNKHSGCPAPGGAIAP